MTVASQVPRIPPANGKRAPVRAAVILNSPFLYGMERAVIELFSGLRPEVDPVFLLSQCTLRENRPILKEIERRGLSYVFMPDRKPWPRLGKPRSLPELWRMVVAWARGNLALFRMGAHCDVFYISSLMAAPYALALATYYRILGKRVVHHFHDLKNSRLLLGAWTPFVTDFVHNSPFGRETVLRDHAQLEKKRNHVLPYIMDLAASGSGSETSQTQRHLVFLGQISTHKGIDYLLDAMPRVATAHPDITLDLLGSCAEGYEGEFQRRLSAAQARANIKFWGYTESAMDLLRGAYLHVQPTPPLRFQESFPRAALEAMACGVPTVCYPSGGLQDMIEDGVTGIICRDVTVDALAAAMDRFLSDPNLRNRCSRNARARYEREYAPSLLRPRWLQLLGRSPSVRTQPEAAIKT